MVMSENSLAQTFDRRAAIYERARPGWPPDAVAYAAGELALERSAAVLDLAAGTGKLTRRLVEHFEHVIAVEPLEGMRAVLATEVPAATVLSGTAERIPLGDTSVDTVFCAEAFHWFEADRAIAEIRRVLRPPGGLVLLWNVRARPTDPSVQEAVDLLEQRGHSDRRAREFRSSPWQLRFTTAGFTPFRGARFDHVHRTDREGLLGYWQSMSWIAGLPEIEQTNLLAEAARLLLADHYTMFWRTELYWTTRDRVHNRPPRRSTVT